MVLLMDSVRETHYISSGGGLMRGNWTSVGKHVFREPDAPIIPTP